MDNQKDPLLEKATDFYRAVIAAKPMNDAMVLQMRDYLVTHFGHEGTKAFREAEGEDIVHTYKGNQQVPRRQFREYIHPMARQAPENQGVVSEPHPELPVKKGGNKPGKKAVAAAAAEMSAALGGNFAANPLPAGQKLENLGESAAPLNSQIAAKADAVEIDEGVVKGMKAKAVSQMYSLEHLRLYADQKGIERDEQTSHVQLASLVIHHLNQA